MNLIGNEKITAIVPETLDMLWYEAETLGRIDVDHSIGSNGAYRVRIRFDRKSGSTIWAEGNDTEIKSAVAKAINEARELGAGNHG